MVVGKFIKVLLMVVSYLLAAITLFLSCSDEIPTIGDISINETPDQIVHNMEASKKENGKISMRMAAPMMEKYNISKDTTYELFPKKFAVYGYNLNGDLETEITSEFAKHSIYGKNETWAAYGNVLINNHIKGEKIFTDTIYWNKEKNRIYTDCYVKIYSPDGLMQGYGLDSDDRARNAVLLKPFDSYSIVKNDSTSKFYLDTANFIGPMPNICNR